MKWLIKMEGWISLYRQIVDNEFYFAERFTKMQAWIDLLLLANHKPTTIFIRGNQIKLTEGQLCYSQLTLSKRWKWNRRTVDNFLSMLQNREMIHHTKTHLTTIISIVQWSEFQKSTQQTAQQTHNRVHTDNNVNNVNKNIEREKYPFDNFWKIYDKKVAREECQKRWDRISNEDKEQIFATLPKYIAATPNKQFRKNPKTYLNNNAWEDELPIPQSMTMNPHNLNSPNKETIPMRQLP
jgi:hypothetical protein